MGLAYEIVFNSNPCIAYLMEENTLTMQALVIAHASYGHNSFFKNNYLFQTWTDAESIIDYAVFARGFIAECERRHGIDAVENVLDACHALMNHGVDRYKRPQPITLDEEKRRQDEREELLQRQVNELWSTIPVSGDDSAQPSASCGSRRSPRRIFSISWRRTHPCWSPGSARLFASCASSPSTSTPSARPRS